MGFLTWIKVVIIGLLNRIKAGILIIWNWFIEFFKELLKPKNFAKYVGYGVILLAVSLMFQNFITPHPKIQITLDPVAELSYNIIIKNTGSKATENLQFRLYHVGGCGWLHDKVENQYYSNTAKQIVGPYSSDIYDKEWLVTGVELNPGVEFDFYCPSKDPFQIRVSGSNFKEVVKDYNP